MLDNKHGKSFLGRVLLGSYGLGSVFWMFFCNYGITTPSKEILPQLESCEHCRILKLFN